MPRTTGAHDIKPETRVAVAIFLTTLSKEGRLCYGTITRAKKVFRLSRASIRGIWGGNEFKLPRVRKTFASSKVIPT
ncbi:hypothetical protein F441_17979 [Phytophthora nicotianae CJ01A1]|uniref:Uncharacterized protein n=2 Tax=Phytophthora nicotianae TaxID=4792 RepID=W2YH32_PHYNI|nr:hypothetical protein F441_17979 [Phytophthora nicotianae CJ01A1]ETP33499.1 hypothetical protein F442_17969 [Phytophthora nicotianae P10297]